ncbi:hypothetical protein O6H91_02G109100 [Diphasiastrum complanatum]|nr:hypothetical protein O6H91_02G109100 [Diphasiastrum complanatum]
MVGMAIDCLANPLGAVRTMFDRACAEGASLEELSRTDWGVKDLFQKFLLQDGVIWQVPDIGSMDISLLSSNSLVRFRGMVQDMFDVEYYIGAYKDGAKWLTTKYTDVASVPVELENDKQIWDRRILYCVPVPGENTWVKQALPPDSKTDVSMYMSGVAPHGEKRFRETSSLTIGTCDMDEDDTFKENFNEGKRMRGSTTSATSCNITDAYQSFDFNMPLGEAVLRPCLVKVYDGADAGIKLNDVVEFIGILTFDPELSSAPQTEHELSNVTTTLLHEDLSILMPASKVPRLQCILLRKLSSHNFLSTLPCLEENFTIFRQTPSVVKQARQSLLQRLTSVLGGDCLAAEYLLIHLLSKVHARVDPIAVGKLSLNFTGCNAEERCFAQNLAESIAALLPCSHFMPLYLESLNRALFSPKKDYQSNRLITGVLQLAEGTHLILDETALTTGQLNATGVQNVQSLKNLMEWQKVEYDFEFHKMEMPIDVPVLILSHAKSKLFPADIIVPLRCTGNQSKLTHDESELNKCRSYLTFVRELEHIIEPSLQKILEDDLVAARQEDRSINTDTFHRWLSMARLMSVSFGEQKLTIEHWHKVKELERRCSERLRCF